MTTILSAGRNGQPRHAAEGLARQIEAVAEATEQLQAGMRAIALGLDYAEYQRFQNLVPGFRYAQNDEDTSRVTIKVFSHVLYSANDEEYEFCLRFVITAALRLAELEALTGEPSWRTAARSASEAASN